MRRGARLHNRDQFPDRTEFVARSSTPDGRERNPAVRSTKTARCSSDSILCLVLALTVATALVFGAGHLRAQVAQSVAFAEAVIAPDAQREDLAVLRHALEQAHPGLLRYATARELEATFAAATVASKAPLIEREFLRQVARILGIVRDDHTYALPSPSFWRDGIGPTRYTQQSSAGALPLFPLFVSVQGKRLFITHNNSAVETIARGAEILTINGVPVADVLARLTPLMPTSGFTQTFRPRHFEQFSPQQEYNGFIVNYALFMGTPDVFRLEVRTPGGLRSLVTVPSVRAPALWANFRKRYVGTGDALLKRNDPLLLTFPSTRTASIAATTFHAWRWNQAKLDYQRDIAAAFARINASGADRLILDLRGNEGGQMEIAVEILRHLTRAPFQIYDYKEMTQARFPELTQYVTNPTDLDHFIPDLFEAPGPNGRIRIKTSLPGETWSRPLPQAAGGFTGRLFVLVDGATGSAAAQLATLIRVNRRDANFVGEEVGGDMDGPVSGSYLSVRLPHSKLRVEVPVLRKVLHLNGYAHQHGRGVIPDQIINPTQQDMALGRDPVAAFALAH